MKGILILDFPEVPQKIIQVFKKRTLLIQLILIIGIILGGWLIWMVALSHCLVRSLMFGLNTQKSNYFLDEDF